MPDMEPPLTVNEQRLHDEMKSWSDAAVEAEILKAHGLPRGNIAKLILTERKRKRQDAQHAAILDEIRKPQWKTAQFWFAAVAAITGCIAIYPILWPKPSTAPAAASPPSAASVPLGGSTPASSQSSKSPPLASSPR